jgi:hypothetical protein
MWAKMHVKNANEMRFYEIKTRKDGKPVGILVKQSTIDQVKKRYPRDLSQTPDEREIIEIVGTRERDNEHDKSHIYRNAVIVNNTLQPYPPNYKPHKMERSNVMKYP